MTTTRTGGIDGAGAGPGERRPLERALGSRLAVVLAVLFVLLNFGAFRGTIGDLFHDTDDAMRLVEVRDFLAGQGWFDLHQYRLDPPTEVPMHWSRFVDLPIAGLILFFRLFLEPATAEKAAMILWPPISLVPMLFGMRELARRLGGAWAGLAAIYLTVTTGPVVAQFVPGRIDHHNVQIGLTVWLLATIAGPAGGRRGIAAGVLVAVMLAVGLETLPFVAIAAAAIALRFVVCGDADRLASGFGATLAVAVPAIAAATLPRVEWLRPACDALSVSYVALAVVGGAGLALAGAVAPRRPVLRALVVGLVGAAAVAAFATPSTRCLAGPFAEVTPEVRALWLDRVTEVQPWLAFTRMHPIAGVLALQPVFLAVVALVVLGRDRGGRNGFGLAVATVSTVAATAIGLSQIRTVVYADVLATGLVAAGIGVVAARVRATGGSVVVAVLAGSVFASPSLSTALVSRFAPAAWTSDAGPAILAAGGADTNGNGAEEAGGSACTMLSHHRMLAALPTGLVAAEVDLGPTILAATPHSVVAAPYHRMQRGIVDVDRMLRGAPEAAIAAIDARGVAYVVACTKASVPEGAEPSEGGLLARLLAGEHFPRFEEVPGDPVIRVFRVLPKPTG